MNLLDIVTAPWLIAPEKFREICNIYATHLRGDKIDIKKIEAQCGEPLINEPQGYETRNGVAIIPIHGVIAKRMNLFTRISGGASTELIARDLKEALEDSAVDSILLDIDSPGGTADGAFELAELVFDSRGEKSITAFTDGMMTSAAYLIGSAADKVFISNKVTQVGSIGVIFTHRDFSKQAEANGVNVTEIFAGKFKAVGSTEKPLDNTSKEVIQGKVDYIYSLFVTDIAKHRGVSEDNVLNDMAEGRIFTGEEAIEAGLVDGVSTFDSLIVDLAPAGAAGFMVNSNTNQTKEGNIMSLPETKPDTEIKASAVTLAYIKTNHPEIVDSIRTESFEAGKAEGLTEGAEAECERIKAVEKCLVPGAEKLIAELKFDGKTTGGEAATQVLNDHQAKLDAQAKVIADEGEDLDNVAPPSAEPGSAGLEAGGSEFMAKVDEHMKAESCTKSVAIKAVADAHPDLRKKYVEAANK